MVDYRVRIRFYKRDGHYGEKFSTQYSAVHEEHPEQQQQYRIGQSVHFNSGKGMMMFGLVLLEKIRFNSPTEVLKSWNETTWTNFQQTFRKCQPNFQKVHFTPTTPLINTHEKAIVQVTCHQLLYTFHCVCVRLVVL